MVIKRSSIPGILYFFQRNPQYGPVFAEISPEFLIIPVDIFPSPLRYQTKTIDNPFCRFGTNSF